MDGIESVLSVNGLKLTTLHHSHRFLRIVITQAEQSVLFSDIPPGHAQAWLQAGQVHMLHLGGDLLGLMDFGGDGTGLVRWLTNIKSFNFPIFSFGGIGAGQGILQIWSDSQ